MSADPQVQPPATFTIELARREVPLAVVVLFRGDGALQVTTLADVPEQVIADAMVAAAFELNEMADLRVPDEPAPLRDEVYDVEADGGVG